MTPSRRALKGRGREEAVANRSSTEPRNLKPPASSGTTGVINGKESDRIPEASGPGRCGESFAPDRSRAWSARSQHHGILQGVQRPDAEGRKEHPDPGGHHDLCRSFLHLRDEDPADVLLPQAGRQDPVRLEGAGPRQGRQGDQGAGARDRREEDEGSQLRHRRDRP